MIEDGAKVRLQSRRATTPASPPAACDPRGASLAPPTLPRRRRSRRRLARDARRSARAMWTCRPPAARRSSVRLPGTVPPPRTASNSGIPMRSRATPCEPISCSCSGVADCATARLSRASRAGRRKRPPLERVPRLALRAAPEPPRRFKTAGRTKINDLRLRHVISNPFCGVVASPRRIGAPVSVEHHLQIAIDGPVASGKTTVARATARRLDVLYLDTGAMYRALAYLALRTGTDVDNGAALARLADCFADRSRARSEWRRSGFASAWTVKSWTERALQSNEVTAIVSAVAAHPEVRCGDG